MSNKTYLRKIVNEEFNKIQKTNYIHRLIKEEYNKILKEDATNSLRTALKKLNYTERAKDGGQINSAGPMQQPAVDMFIEFFEFLKKEHPDVRIEVTGGNDKHHKEYISRHVFGEALDFIVTSGEVSDVLQVLKDFSKKDSNFKYLDEYSKQTEGATGKHFHIAYKGADSKFAQAKADGLPEFIPGSNRLVYPSQAKEDGIGYNPKDSEDAIDQDTRGDDVILGKKLKVTDFASINKWEGSANGVDLELLDNFLANWASKAKGGGSNIRLYQMKASMIGDKAEDVEEKSHKWVIQALVKVPKKEKDQKYHDKVEKGIYGGKEPDAEGFIGVAPETLTFYPSGHVYLYNQQFNCDPVITERRTALEKIYDYFTESTGEKIHKATLQELDASSSILRNNPNIKATPSKLTSLKKDMDFEGKCIQLENVSGDLVATLYLDKKGRFVFDLTGASMFSVDDNYEPTGSEKFFNQLQFVLDLVGFIPVIGDVVDLINAVIYLMRDRYFEAILSFIAIIPVVGSVIKFSAKASFRAASKASSKAIKSFGFNYLSKNLMKKLFKPGKEGQKAAEMFLEELVKAKIISYEDLSKIDFDFVRKLFTGKINKASQILDKYVPGMNNNMFKNYAKELDGAADNISMALKKYQDEAFEKGKVLSPFGPRAYKKAAGDIGTDGITKVNNIINKSGGLWNKLGLFRRTKNLITRIPPKRAEMIKKWMIEDVTEQLIANPKLYSSFLQSVGAIQGGSKYIAKLAPGQKAKLLQQVMKNKQNIIIKQLMAKPGTYFKAQIRQGIKGTLGDLAKGDISSLKDLMVSAMGAKQFDVAYNEIKEVLWREGGIDIGGYGDEQESLVAAFLFKIFCNEESQKMRRDSWIGAREKVGMMAGVLKFIGIQNPTAYLDRSQIQDINWNQLPGDTDADKMTWVRTHGRPNDVKTIEKLAYEPLVKANKLDAEENKKD